MKRKLKFRGKKAVMLPMKGWGKWVGGGGLTSHSVVVRIGRKAC